MNKRGILHKMMLLVILFAGFGLALTLPAWKRYTDVRHERQALKTGYALAEAEKLFFANHGVYTDDFWQLGVPSTCHSVLKEGHRIWHCPGYEIDMHDNQALWVSSTKYPQRFLFPLDQGPVSCEYEEGSLVGERLCQAVGFVGHTY